MKKSLFNKYFSKPVGLMLIAEIVCMLCAAESLVDNGMWWIAAIGVFLPIGIVAVLYRNGLMEWLNEPVEGKFD